MAKKRKVTKAEGPKTRKTRALRETEPEIEIVDAPEVRRVVRRRVREPEVIEVEQETEGTRWFGVNPWVVILGIIGLLFLLLLPVCPATKVIETTETVMVPVTTGQPRTVEGQETIKVYVGWMRDVAGGTYTIDVSEEIVEVKKVRGPNNTWVYSLIDYSGAEVIYRGIIACDLTKTGRMTLSTTETEMERVTEQMPEQVTKQETIEVRVNLIQLMFGIY